MESISFWVVPAEVASEAEEPSELLVESEPEVELLPELPVYIDTSFSTGRMTPADSHYSEEELQLLDSDGFMELVRAFGPSRVLFGSDSPWSSQSESLDWIRARPLAGDELHMMLGGNAAGLLGL